jgi:hypothetical protein
MFVKFVFVCNAARENVYSLKRARRAEGEVGGRGAQCATCIAYPDIW